MSLSINSNLLNQNRSKLAHSKPLQFKGSLNPSALPQNSNYSNLKNDTFTLNKQSLKRSNVSFKGGFGTLASKEMTTVIEKQEPGVKKTFSKLIKRMTKKTAKPLRREITPLEEPIVAKMPKDLKKTSLTSVDVMDGSNRMHTVSGTPGSYQGNTVDFLNEVKRATPYNSSIRDQIFSIKPAINGSYSSAQKDTIRGLINQLPHDQQASVRRVFNFTGGHHYIESEHVGGMLDTIADHSEDITDAIGDAAPFLQVASYGRKIYKGRKYISNGEYGKAAGVVADATAGAASGSAGAFAGLKAGAIGGAMCGGPVGAAVGGLGGAVVGGLGGRKVYNAAKNKIQKEIDKMISAIGEMHYNYLAEKYHFEDKSPEFIREALAYEYRELMMKSIKAIDEGHTCIVS